MSTYISLNYYSQIRLLTTNSMRVKLVFTNYEVNGASSFIIAIPFESQTFGDLSEYLTSHFDLPSSTKFIFSIDGFSILYKENVFAILKELDILK